MSCAESVRKLGGQPIAGTGPQPPAVGAVLGHTGVHCPVPGLEDCWRFWVVPQDSSALTLSMEDCSYSQMIDMVLPIFSEPIISCHSWVARAGARQGSLSASSTSVAIVPES